MKKIFISFLVGVSAVCALQAKEIKGTVKDTEGKGVAGADYHIDAVSGATITCNGLQVMLETKLAPYYNYLQSNVAAPKTVPAMELVPATEVVAE